MIESSRGYDGLRDFDLVPVDIEQARVVREAYRRYGFPYALAKATDLPLLAGTS